MKKTLQDQYLLIKEGKGHTGVFLSEAKRQFADLIPINADFKLTTQILKDKNIINENIVGLQAINQMIPSKKESFETAFETFLKEAKKKEETDKAEAKAVSKSVEEKQEHTHDNTDEKNIDNVIFDQVMMGYYAEIKDPKNADKTMEELKAMVLKNLAKDPIHYTKDGQFGIKGLGYTDEFPGLGKTKEVKGKYASSGMEPVKLNESVEEAYQMTSVSVGNAKTGGKRFVPEKLPVSPLIIKRFGDHMVFDATNNIMYVSAILYNNLIKGYADQPAIKKLIMDIPPMVKQLLNKTQNYGRPKMLNGYKFKQYFPFEGVVEIASDDKFNKDGTKQYYSKGDYLFQNLNKLQEDMPINESISPQVEKLSNKVMSWYENHPNPKMSERINSVERDLEKLISFTTGKNKWTLDKFQSTLQQKFPLPFNDPEYSKFKQSMSTNESKLRTIIRSIIAEEVSKMPLNENVHKRLKEIDGEVANEVTQSKLNKVQEEIEKRQAQLNMLDENEDLKDLTDGKKIKALQKEIKLLEKAKAKLEKSMKGKKKEVLDETENVDEASPEYMAAKQDAESRYNEGEDIDSIIADYPQFKRELYNDIIGGFEDMDY